MNRRLIEAKTSGLSGVANALQRAAFDARLIAARTGTPLVFSRNGKIEKAWITEDELPSLRKAFEQYLSAVPNNEPSETDRLT